MSIRRPLLRIAGFGVVAVVLTAAAQLLLLSFETTPVLSASRLDDLTEWVRGRPRVGVAMLAGVALCALALVLLYSVARSGGRDRREITTRRGSARTSIDRPSLEAALGRQLELVDRRNDVRVKVTRRGRVDLTIVTPDPKRTGPLKELRDELDELCVERGLPCRSGRIVASTPRRTNARRRVR